MPLLLTIVPLNISSSNSADRALSPLALSLKGACAEREKVKGIIVRPCREERGEQVLGHVLGAPRYSGAS